VWSAAIVVIEPAWEDVGSVAALWATVQIAPYFRGAALLNDAAIVLFIADLAFVLMPWRLVES
jgi:hypothetical protein